MGGFTTTCGKCGEKTRLRKDTFILTPQGLKDREEEKTCPNCDKPLVPKAKPIEIQEHDEKILGEE